VDVAVYTAVLLIGDSRPNFFDASVNTAARMESNGRRNSIHVSVETADLLRGGGKGHWLVKRADRVIAKGKGELETYWLEMKQQSSGSQHSGKSARSGTSTTSGTSTDVPNPRGSSAPKAVRANVEVDDPVMPAKISRLVKWNADVLVRVLKQVVARREALEQLKMDGSSASTRSDVRGSQGIKQSVTGTVIDEVIEVIELPKFNAGAAKIQRDAKDIEIDPKAVQQLHDYITVIASMYRMDVPFHNVSPWFGGRFASLACQLTLYVPLPPLVRTRESCYHECC
jgi:Adenylate and Guanylate cyclase catalytic domain